MTKKIRGVSYQKVRVGGGRIHKNGYQTPISYADRKEAWRKVREYVEEAQKEREISYAQLKKKAEVRKRQDAWINAFVLGGAFILTAAIVVIIVIVGTM